MRAESRLSRRRLLQGTAAGTAIAAARMGTRFTPSARAQGNVTLTFWSEYSTDPARSTMDDAIKAFQDANPGITVDHRPIENEQFFTVLRTGFTSGEPPDIFQHEGHQNLFQFSDQGEIEAIDDLYADLEERFIPGTAAAISKDGHYYGVPWSIHTDTQIFHNETVLQANGIDPATLKTWDDYLATFAALKEAGVTPVAFANKFGWSGSQWFFAFLVRQVGADPVLDLCARVGDRKWTDPGFVKAAQYYVDLNSQGFFSSGAASDDYPSATALFFAGRSGFFQTGSWLLGSVEAEAPPDFKIGLNTFPTLSGGEGDPDNIVMQVIGGYSLSKKGAADPAKREAALKFLTFLTELPQAQDWVKRTQSMTAVKDSVTNETASPQLLKIVEEQVDGNTGSFPFLEHILPKEVGEDAIWMGSVGVLTGQLDAESWMANVEAEAEKHDPVFSR
jgi:raffinose/stachyose/melibiose transport system substrate-binding protein